MILCKFWFATEVEVAIGVEQRGAEGARSFVPSLEPLQEGPMWFQWCVAVALAEDNCLQYAVEVGVWGPERCVSFRELLPPGVALRGRVGVHAAPGREAEVRRLPGGREDGRGVTFARTCPTLTPGTVTSFECGRGRTPGADLGRAEGDA